MQNLKSVLDELNHSFLKYAHNKSYNHLRTDQTHQTNLCKASKLEKLGQHRLYTTKLKSSFYADFATRSNVCIDISSNDQGWT